MKKNGFKKFLGLFAFLFLLSSVHSEEVRVAGTVEGFGSLRRDGIVDGAIVLPSLRSRDLLNFQIDQLLGPDEPLKVGPITPSVSSNFFLPKQRERFAFIPITLKKDEFALFLREDVPEELSALSFKAPFDELMDIGMSEDAPPTRLLPLVDVQKLSFREEQNWTAESNVEMNLNLNLDESLNFRWNRSAHGEEWSDHAFYFQSTELDRWVLSDIKGDVGNRGALRSSSALESAGKAFFARMEENEDVNNIRGYIKNIQGESSVTVNGVPPVMDASIDAENLIRWTPIESFGWLAVITEKAPPEESLFTKSMNILGKFLGLQNQEELKKIEWMDARLASHRLDFTPQEKDNITVLFVGTEEEVAMPNPEDENPEMVHVLKEIRLRTLQ